MNSGSKREITTLGAQDVASMEDALAKAHLDLRQKMEAVHWVRGHDALEKAHAEWVQAKATATAIYSKVKAQRARLAALEIT